MNVNEFINESIFRTSIFVNLFLKELNLDHDLKQCIFVLFELKFNIEKLCDLKLWKLLELSLISDFRTFSKVKMK